MQNLPEAQQKLLLMNGRDKHCLGFREIASSLSFYKRSSEFLIFELRFYQNESELRLYLQEVVVSCNLLVRSSGLNCELRF
jgi:hypothetical protein